MVDRKKAHAIVFPIPYQGHINPMTNLALKLASKGFAITFVHTEYIYHTLSKAHNKSAHDVDFFSTARDCGLDIRCTTISDGFPLEFDRTLHFDEYWQSMLRNFAARVDEFVETTIKDDPFSAYFLVADTSYTWLANIARKHNLVSVSFWTEPALVFAFIYHWDLLEQNGYLCSEGDVSEEINYLPGVESINRRDVLPFLREKGSKETLLFKLLSLLFEEVKKVDFILHNTVQELEVGTLSSLNEKQPNHAIGPVNFFNTPGSLSVSKSLWSETDCNDWLDSKPPGSVLYVSFGSFVQIDKQVMEEVAYGLLLSGVNFLWVVRSGIAGVDTNALPAGFEEEIRDKGLIVPWCNQITVLSNPAIVGFLTHCGWNSTFESIWCGVPMLCYPVSFDQHTNRKLVVEDWKIGVSLCDGPSVRREEVVEKIKSLLIGTTSECFKKEIKKIQSVVRDAIECGGSSERNLNKFIEDLNAKLHLN